MMRLRTHVRLLQLSTRVVHLRRATVFASAAWLLMLLAFTLSASGSDRVFSVSRRDALAEAALITGGPFCLSVIVDRTIARIINTSVSSSFAVASWSHLSMPARHRRATTPSRSCPTSSPMQAAQNGQSSCERAGRPM